MASSAPILNYDSPWEELLEAAQDVDISQPTATRRGLFDDAELSALCGFPVCCIEVDERAPPPLPCREQDNPLRGDYLRQRAMAQGWAYTDYMYWPRVATDEASGVSMRQLPSTDPGMYPLRQGTSFGSEFRLQPPLAHRLSGDKMSVLGVITLGAIQAEDRCVAHPRDSRINSQLHEMFHLLQLWPSRPSDQLLMQVERERDADNAALTAFQTHFGGAPGVAAREVLARTLNTMTGTTAKYLFWPGLDGRGLLHGPTIATPLLLHGLYGQAGEAAPPAKLQEMWAMLSAGVMPANIYAEHRTELDSISTFVQAQHPLGPAAALRSIADSVERADPALSGSRADLARKVVQAARVLQPAWLA